MANRFLSNIRINDAYTFPASDGTNGQVIVTDGSGNLSFSTIQVGDAADAVIYKENFTGNGSQTDFVLERAISSSSIAQVYLNGIYQEQTVYTLTNFDTISFSTAPPDGHTIEILYYYSVDVIPTTSAAIYRDNFTGNGTQTTFTLSASIANEDVTQVYIDGAYQEKSTYSANGTDLVFSTAPADGHSVEVISITGVNVASNLGPTLIYQDNFTGNGTTTNFTLANQTNSIVKTMVYFNGVYQFKGTYTLDGSDLVFSTAPANGVEIEVITIASTFGEDQLNSQKIVFYGKATGTINKGDAVMFAGAEGDHFLFAKATQAAIEANHELFIGLADQNLVNNEFGYVVEFGLLTGIDTTVYGVGAGSTLWFDSAGSTPGALTATEPTPPNAKIQVAAIVRLQQSVGSLFIRPTWYHELGELHDVNITSVNEGDLLKYDNGSGTWINGKIALQDLTDVVVAAATEGQVLTYDGVNGWQPENTQVVPYTVSEIGVDTTAVANGLYVLTASLTLTLPASPSIGDKIAVSNMSDTLTSVIARNGNLIVGLAEDFTFDALNVTIELIYTGATKGWVIL